MKPFEKSKLFNIRGKQAKVVAVRVTKDLHDGVLRQAEKEHRTVGSQITLYIERGLEADREKKGEHE